jgi:hypothetical protein
MVGSVRSLRAGWCAGRALQRVDAIVKRGAIDAEQACRLAHVVVGELLRGFDVGFLPEPQRGVEVEIAAALYVAEGNRHEFGPAGRSRHRQDAGGWRIPRIEFGFQFVDADFLAGKLGRQADRYIAQFADIAGKSVGEQAFGGARAEPEGRQIGLRRIDGAEVFQQADTVVAELAQGGMAMVNTESRW